MARRTKLNQKRKTARVVKSLDRSDWVQVKLNGAWILLSPKEVARRADRDMK